MSDDRKTISIRVPREVHTVAKTKAAIHGMDFNAYVLSLINADLETEMGKKVKQLVLEGKLNG